MDFCSAGSRRKRKNAVSINDGLEEPSTRPRGRGRPSKGGQALRSKRYYVKNHMLVLQKRKLKRYMDKANKIASEANYNASTILNQLTSKCIEYTKRYHPNIKMNRLLNVLDSTREDRHLDFLNEEGLKFLAEFNDAPIGLEEDILTLREGLASSHSVLQYLLSTLLSAHLLVRHVRAVHQNVADADEREELVKRDCKDYYEISFDHLQLTGNYDEQGDQIAIQVSQKSATILDIESTSTIDQENTSTVDEDQKHSDSGEESEVTPTIITASKPVQKEIVKKKRKLRTKPLHETASS